MSGGRSLSLHFDGGSRGNPGPAAIGVRLIDAQTHQPVHEAGYFLGETTNNVAEYKALLQGLAIAARLEPASLTIYSDSELLVRQITGQYRVKSQALKPLFEQAQAKLVRLGHWSIQHVRRESNQRADALANEAMDAGEDVVALNGLDAAESPSPERGQAQGSFFGGDADQADAGPSNPGAGASDTTATARGADGDAATSACLWRVTFADAQGCALGCDTEATYSFGPATPAGLCVHAAAAVFNVRPLDRLAGRVSVETPCQRCGLTIRLTPGGGEPA
jgi:ribonuclease HI